MFCPWGCFWTLGIRIMYSFYVLFLQTIPHLCSAHVNITCWTIILYQPPGVWPHTCVLPLWMYPAELLYWLPDAAWKKPPGVWPQTCVLPLLKYPAELLYWPADAEWKKPPGVWPHTCVLPVWMYPCYVQLLVAGWCWVKKLPTTTT